MRILVDGMPRSIGGIGTLLLNIVDYNLIVGNKDKYIFEFLLPRESEYKILLSKKNITFYEIPKISNIEYKYIIKKIFNNNRYDFLWINNTSKINLILPQIAKEKGVMIISHSHGVSCEETGLKKIIFTIIEKIFSSKYDNLIDIPFACSEESADYFYHGELRRKCKVLHNGIWVNKFQFNPNYRREIRTEYEIDDQDILMGTIGRITRVKNYPFLIELLGNLSENYKLFIIGNGEDYKLVEDLIIQRELKKRVYLLGLKKDVERYLSAMDIFLMPSLNEGLPFALIEAQASGLKCIVSNGISKEANILGNVDFVEINSITKWIQHIEKLKHSVNRREAIKNIIVNGYSIELSYQEIVEVMENLLYED